MVKFRSTQKKQVQLMLSVWVIQAFDGQAKAHGIAKTTDAMIQALEQLANEMEEKESS